MFVSLGKVEGQGHALFKKLSPAGMYTGMQMDGVGIESYNDLECH